MDKCKFPDGVVVKLDGIHEMKPHAYRLKQKLKNVTVEILECSECGDVSIGWYRQEDTEEIEYLGTDYGRYFRYGCAVFCNVASYN